MYGPTVGASRETLESEHNVIYTNGAYLIADSLIELHMFVRTMPSPPVGRFCSDTLKQIDHDSTLRWITMLRGCYFLHTATLRDMAVECSAVYVDEAHGYMPHHFRWLADRMDLSCLGKPWEKYIGQGPLVCCGTCKHLDQVAHKCRAGNIAYPVYAMRGAYGYNTAISWSICDSYKPPPRSTTCTS